MKRNLVFKAGKKAYQQLRDGQLRADDVKVVAGAAGGPKWLMLAEMDRFLFGEWLPQRKEELYLLGSSIGAWRFAMYTMAEPLKGLNNFLASYVGQSYSERPTPQEIADTMTGLLSDQLTPSVLDEILQHPTYRLNVMAVRCRHLLSSDKSVPLTAGLVISAAANALSRRTLRLFYERTLFHHPEFDPPFFGSDGQKTHRVPLQKENIADALFASGSIPFVVPGQDQIQGAPKGIYRDGGMIDYHMDLAYNIDEGIVLFPHFTPRVIPGWFDKSLPWRKPSPRNMERTLLIAPSEDFIKSLPNNKIPDRRDFTTYAGRNEARKVYWEAVLGETEALRDELVEALHGNKLKDWVEPWL